MENITLNKEGDMPLMPDHICFNKGHSIFQVYTLHNFQSSYGLNKCSRCGYEEEWQYDHIGYNPMFKEE